MVIAKRCGCWPNKTKLSVTLCLCGYQCSSNHRDTEAQRRSRIEMLSTDEIRRRVAELGQWFHNLDLAGVQTAPDHFLGDYPQMKWQRFCGSIPEDLSGKSVLDVGCNAGFYSIQMKRRGAERVVRSEEHTSELQSHVNL